MMRREQRDFSVIALAIVKMLAICSNKTEDITYQLIDEGIGGDCVLVQACRAESKDRESAWVRTYGNGSSDSV